MTLPVISVVPFKPVWFHLCSYFLYSINLQLLKNTCNQFEVAWPTFDLFQILSKTACGYELIHPSYKSSRN